MSDHALASNIGDLPETLSIFPLPGALLLPRGHLPLHIFEPRYRNLTRDALAGDRMIGMVQPLEADTADDHPAVYATGCVGKISSCSRTTDGRYYFTLIGVIRFDISRELPPLDGYRRVVTDYTRYTGDLALTEGGALDRSRLAGAMRSYLDTRGIDADWEAVDKAEDEQLVTSLAMLCPFAPSEKQALLESPTIEARGGLLIALMEMSALHGESDNAVRH